MMVLEGWITVPLAVRIAGGCGSCLLVAASAEPAWAANTAKTATKTPTVTANARMTPHSPAPPV
jgi:hypothetical protein